jgi:hypothetical protein
MRSGCFGGLAEPSESRTIAQKVLAKHSIPTPDCNLAWRGAYPGADEVGALSEY